MIDARRAIVVAKTIAADFLGQANTNLEELERESYKDREVWSITLSYPRDLGLGPLTEVAQAVARLGPDQLEYKRFLIDAQTGDLVAMKLRELAIQ